MTVTEAEINSLKAIVESINGLAATALQMIDKAEERAGQPAPAPEKEAEHPLRKRLEYMGADDEPPAKGA